MAATSNSIGSTPFIADLSALSIQGGCIQEQVLSGAIPLPERGSLLPSPFKGTRAELLAIVTDTVHQTIDNLDYNGLWPYLKIADQLDQGKTFREISIDSRNEERGTTCAGMSQTLLKNLKETHGIEGILAVQRKVGEIAFEHAAVIIECADGFVLLDARSNPKDRIFSIPYYGTEHSFTASGPGSTTPLTVKYEKTDDHPETIFEYCTDISNGDDLVMKHFVMTTFSSRVPISLYNPDGSARKFILIIPAESKIIFKDNTAPKELRTQEVVFKLILEGELRPTLEAFMTPTYCSIPPGFHTSVDTVYAQIVRFASQAERLKQLFLKTNIDERN